MADVLKALFNGTAGTTMATYTPDIGDPFVAAINVDLDDGAKWFKGGTSTALSLLELDGSGAAKANWVLDTDPPIVFFRLPDPATADYFIEATISADFDSALIASDEIFMAMRAVADGSWTNARDFLGVKFQVIGSDSTLRARTYTVLDGTITDNEVYSSDPKSPGQTTVVVRAEIVDNELTLKVDGIQVFTDTFPSWSSAGEVYFGFAPYGNNYVGDYYLDTLLGLRYGPLPEVTGDFWTNFIKTRES